jgi:hypothetical protein
MKLKSEVAKVMNMELGAVNNLWVYKEILGLSDEEIEDYATYLPGDEGEEGEAFDLGNINPKLMNQLKADPLVRLAIQDMRDILAMKRQRDKDADRLKTVGIDREEKLSDKY